MGNRVIISFKNGDLVSAGFYACYNAEKILKLAEEFMEHLAEYNSTENDENNPLQRLEPDAVFAAFCHEVFCDSNFGTFGYAETGFEIVRNPFIYPEPHIQYDLKTGKAGSGDIDDFSKWCDRFIEASTEMRLCFHTDEVRGFPGKIEDPKLFKDLIDSADEDLGYLQVLIPNDQGE